MQRLTITGTIDGTNPTFTLSAAPVILKFYRNGLLQSPTADYGLSGTVITCLPASIPDTGDDLQALGRTV